MKTPKGTKPAQPPVTPKDNDNPPGMIQCGIVNDLKMGMAELNRGAGVLVEFMPDMKLPPIGFVLAPHMAVAMRKQLESMEKEFGWTETTVSPVLRDALLGKKAGTDA
jgi:hypothetical protein